ncbi:hypothetical protein BC937DRAFT_93474, partial [Endogone sp. FLAS-F59071]
MRIRRKCGQPEDAPMGCFAGVFRKRARAPARVPEAAAEPTVESLVVVDQSVAETVQPDVRTASVRGEAERLPRYEECMDQAMNHLNIGKNEEVEREITEAIENISPRLREISLKIHADPELGEVEYHAHDLLTAYLEDLGFTVTRHAYDIPTAFLAEFSMGSGRRVGFCSEYDALPGIGHACGHNLIAISGVAAAVGVKVALEKGRASGTVVLFGTPAEESTSGKTALLKKKAFQSRVDVCLMLHPAPQDIVYVAMLAIDGIKVDYYGKASHASGSRTVGSLILWFNVFHVVGINAVDAVVQAWNNISMLRQQILPTDRIHGIITEGGEAANVIPAHASALFYVRSIHRSQLEQLKPRVEACFRAAAEATGCGVKTSWHERGVTYDVLVNEVLAKRYQLYAERAGFKFDTRANQEAFSHGSTDFGNV